MRPSSRLLRLMSLWCLAIAVLGVVELRLQSDWLWSLWLASALILGMVLMVDMSARGNVKRLGIRRELPRSLALGVQQSVFLSVQNPLNETVLIEVADHHPASVKVHGLPRTVRLAPKGAFDVEYTVMPTERGLVSFNAVDIRLTSRWGFWQFRHVYHMPQQVRVYPNFAPIAQHSLLRFEQQMGQMGIHLQQRRGEGLEFQQLREFREGDALRQVDWKASARARKPISREYQDERDQEVVYLIDCGRRMRAKDGELSHFDHALNATLLSAYIALRQGDAAGVLAFAGEPRWIPPVKGRNSINHLLNHVYDIRSTTQASDFLQAAEQVQQRQQKRSLIVIVTNVQEQDAEDLRAATALLSKRHVVMVASLREQSLETRLETPVEDFNDALDYAGTVALRSKRLRLLETLKKTGVAVVDALPATLHTEMISQYLSLKRAGRI